MFEASVGDLSGAVRKWLSYLLRSFQLHQDGQDAASEQGDLVTGFCLSAGHREQRSAATIY
ncbi:hypothetical protein Asn12ST33_07795 [Cutibacterium acnes]|nr:hypothetical protein Asn12ST33_07795 [Cutibacterium acnes]